jgi:zinc transporter ZupT
MQETLDLVLSDSFMPHGYCFLWRPELVWMHAITDAIIALAYITIPITIVTIVKKRQSRIPFLWVFWMFATFIFLCGLTHIVELIGIWKSFYYLEGVLKIITAAISLATAIMMFPLIPVLIERFRSLDEPEKRKKEE